MFLLPLLFAATSALRCDLKPVQNLVKTDARSSVIRIRWSAPSAEDLQCIRGYDIIYATPEDSPTWFITVHNASTNEYSITGLRGCTPYTVSVAALGEGDAASEPVYVTATTAPERVYGLTGSRKDNDTITAQWYYDRDRDGACATQFEITYCNARLTNCTTTNVAVSGSDYKVDFNKYWDCNSYVLMMSVFDRDQQRSDDGLPFPGNPDITGVPGNLTVTDCSSKSFDLEWTLPSSRDDCEYLVLVFVSSTVGDTGYSYTTTHEVGRTNHTQKNVTSCTAFDVSVSFGWGENVNAASTTVYTLPEGDKLFENVAVQEETSSSVRVAWNTSLPIDQCIAAYSACWRKQSTAGVDCRNATSEENSLRISGLAANTKYQVSIAAILHTGIEFDKVTLDASTKPEI